ncbi:MAG: DegT/DnrJ/EryC1/StrS family aminotransferase [candidate division WOR-3 bacterium]
MSETVSFYTLTAENQEFGPRLHQVLERVLDSGRFVLGNELQAFESELADYLGVPQVTCLKSGTDALYYGLKALGIGPGDEVLTSPFTFSATVEAITRTGATPVFADIEPITLCLDPERCAEQLTARTRAIVLVHLFGNCGDLDRFVRLCRSNNLLLIEDAAQALGAEFQGRKLGSFGDAAIFSFYPTKNLGALGNGGALVLNRPLEVPNSARLDELQAGFLRLKLPHLDDWNARRRELAERYRLALHPWVRFATSHPDSLPNCHQFAILTPDRDRLRQFLSENGIQTMIYYPDPLYPLPVAARVASEILCLPVRHSLTFHEQGLIINKIQEFFRTVS